MNNFYIYFAVNMNLIFLAGKIFNAIDWPWLWVMSPLIILTVIGIIVTGSQKLAKNRMRSDIASILGGIQDLVKKAKKEKEAERRTIN